MNEKIVAFLKQNTNFSLATSINDKPYCASCFYVFAEKFNYIIFKSKIETNHIQQAKSNEFVAGTITQDVFDVKNIKGIQFNGIFCKPSAEIKKQIDDLYYVKYPFAVSFSGDIWAIELTYIKMTDNTLGFGKKIEWKK